MVVFLLFDFRSLFSKLKIFGEIMKFLLLFVMVFVNFEDVVLFNKKFGIFLLLIKEDIGRFVFFFSVCDFLVDGGLMKMKYRLNGILCCLCDIKLFVFVINVVEVKM